MKKFTIFLSFLAISTFVIADSNSFPSKPLTLLIGFERGGTVYSQAEALAEVLTDILQQPVTLQIRSGLGGGIAAAMMAESLSEGYIMLFTPSVPITNSSNSPAGAFQIEDFRYLGSISEDQNALVTYSDAPYSNWVEFIEFAKLQDEILYASQNITDRHFINIISEKEGFNVRIIPVSGGSGMAPLILGKDVDLAFSGGTHNRYVDSGEMKVLASANVDRLAEQPDVPTLMELGYELSMQSLRIIIIPKNTPDEHFEVLSNALQNAVEDPRLTNVTREVIRHPMMYMNGNELKSFIESTRKQYLSLIGELEIEN